LAVPRPHRQRGIHAEAVDGYQGQAEKKEGGKMSELIFYVQGDVFDPNIVPKCGEVKRSNKRDALICKFTNLLCCRGNCPLIPISTHDREKDAEIAELKKRNAVFESALNTTIRKMFYTQIGNMAHDDFEKCVKGYYENAIKLEAELKAEEK
jgi:hypothetical protein